MTRALPLLLLSLAASALMWLTAARGLLPMQAWPAPPFRPEAMSLPQILLAFGLMPRGIIALLAGAALGLSGAILQAV
ncbi:MAG: Fe(3+)-hydroxamate ABC transporter permease FhuB, partial [Paracoccus sp. (in: a-proteobacteria)]